MQRASLIISLLATILAPTTLAAQHPTGIGYYDVERLYDTEPSLFYDDRNYTPEGRYAWDEERYRRKVENIAAVIDTLALPVIALYGVENECVVRDIVAASKMEYGYVHRTLSTNDGLDFALLYFGDRLFIEEVESGFDYLSITCELDRKPTLILLTRYSDAANDIIRRVRTQEEQRRIVIAGRTERVKIEKYGLRDACIKAQHAGRGNCIRNNRWEMKDRIIVDKYQTGDAEVFIAYYLIDAQGLPRGTFSYGRYIGGYSENLPIYIFID